MAWFARLRKLSYHPLIIRLVRRLGIRAAARRVYGWFAVPRSGRTTVPLPQGQMLFHTRTLAELRGVEAVWLNERRRLDALQQTLRPGDVFYDVGGYQGVYTVYAALLVGPTGRVVVFEPDPGSRAMLEENVRLNALTNVRIEAYALGDRAETAVLHVGEVAGNQSLRAAAVLGDAARREPVAIKPGDALRQEPWAAPRAVKIDVEGWELEVLNGLDETLRDPRCVLVCCEVHPEFLAPGRTADDVVAALERLGYGVEGRAAGRQPFPAIARRLSAAAARAAEAAAPGARA